MAIGNWKAVDDPVKAVLRKPTCIMYPENWTGD
jgi:hypothetical protein